MASIVQGIPNPVNPIIPKIQILTIPKIWSGNYINPKIPFILYIHAKTHPKGRAKLISCPSGSVMW